MGRLENRVALVTGASRGIGRAIALRFAQEGARVCLSDIDGHGATIAAEKMRTEGLQISPAKLDVTNRAEVEAVVSEVTDRHGRLDILVNNAGITRDNLVFKMTDEDWKSVMEVHLTGAFLCTRAAQKPMVAGGYGRIINVSSVAALGNRGQSNYSAAKAGLIGLTKTLAIELGRFGITANAVAPGFIETEMTRITAQRMGRDFDDFRSSMVEGIPVGRSGKPEDVASAILYLASEEASFVSGQVLYVAGGPVA